MEIANAAMPNGIANAGAAAADSSMSKTSNLANEDTFLQLLVAQIKNQDPLQPTDGVQFLSQLAQFSQLEQLIGIKQGINALQTSGTAPADGAASTGSTPSAAQITSDTRH